MTMKRREILVCRSTGCNSLDAKEVHDELIKQIKEQKILDVQIKLVGCMGLCQCGPSINIQPDNVYYVHLKPSDVPEIIEKHLKNDEIVQHLVYMDPTTEGFIPNMEDIPY